MTREEAAAAANQAHQDVIAAEKRYWEARKVLDAMPGGIPLSVFTQRDLAEIEEETRKQLHGSR